MKTYLLPSFFLLLILSLYTNISAQMPSAEHWTYLAIDSSKQKWGDWAEPDWLRYFGLDVGDVDRDGCLDIVSGRYVYHNPCGDMTDAWSRTVLDDNVDAILFLDVDGDPFADIIAQALPDLYWYEALDEAGRHYRRHLIGQVPATSHVNSQGFERAQIIEGGRPEILIAGNGDIYCVQIPEEDPTTTDWPVHLIAANTSDEGIGTGDIDGDGDLDIAAGRRPEGEGEPTILVWYENPGAVTAPWKDRVVGNSLHPIDRVEIADVNGDERADIIMTEERYPGLEPDGHLFWFAQPSAIDGSWERHEVVQQHSMNNLDIADVDRDGDIDLVTNEHKGPALELQWWENDGQGNFTKHILDTGKENHLGAQLADLDGDGDLDIVGAAWDHYRWMHVWRNDAVRSPRSGDVFREYSWTPDMVSDDGKFLRVGGRYDYSIHTDHFPPEQHQEGFINFGQEIDLDGAVRAEVVVERVQSHEGTHGLAIQVNDSRRLPVPLPSRIPEPAINYLFHDQPVVPIPLENLRPGDNNAFRLQVDTAQAWGWPQNLIYGLVLRVYYAVDAMPVQIRGIDTSDTLGNQIQLSVQSPDLSNIARVDYIGFYEDVDWSGQGIYQKWQYAYHRGRLGYHIGQATQSPFQVEWSTDWLPDQWRPMRLVAWVTDQQGRIHVTPSIDNLHLQREHSVYLAKAYGQPPYWVTRSGERSQGWQLPFDPAAATAAQLFWRSWSPCYSSGLWINDRPLEQEPSDWPCYDYYDHQLALSDLTILQAGENLLRTGLTPKHNGHLVHGMEVQWPGIAMKVKRPKPETKFSQILETTYAGRPHYLITTPAATYYYDQAGGGFSRIIDRQGNDWVSFQREPWNEYPASAASSYRGLPNLVFQSDDGGAGHPGFDRCRSYIADDGSIVSESLSGNWKWSWHFQEDHARLRIEQVDSEQPYWFLYEGTPGGAYQPDDYYFGTDQGGPEKELPDLYRNTSRFENYRWAYFGHQQIDRVGYVLQVEADDKVDMLSFLGNTNEGVKSPDGMTVFGFGRAPDTKPLLTKPQEFIFGFYPTRISNIAEHQQFADYLQQQFLSRIKK